MAMPRIPNTIGAPPDKYALSITIWGHSWPEIMVQLVQILARLTKHKITKKLPIPSGVGFHSSQATSYKVFTQAPAEENPD